MKKIYILFFTAVVFALPAMVKAQVSSYTFTPLSGTYTPIVGTSPTLTGDGSNPLSDEGYSNALPIGFSFVFSGTTYTTLGVSTNGFISFGTPLTAWGFTNNISTGPTGTATSRPLIAPLWDDFDLQATTNLQYTTSGAPGSRVFVMQWSNVKWDYQAAAAGIEFQVRLYETSNLIEFVYNQLPGALSFASASIGLAAAGTGVGNFLCLNNASASPTASSTTATNTISAKPATGQVYRFTPPSCSAPGGLTASNVTQTTADLSWSTVPGSSGYEYAVTTSATPPASGTATLGTTFNATGLTAVTQYYLHVRTNCGAIFSGWATLPFMTSFDCSVATNISACGVSQSASIAATPGSYNIVACGFNTPGGELLYTFTAPTTGNYTLNITAANGEYIDYFYKAVSGGCAPSGWTCIDDNAAIGTDVFGPLTAGITYYILLDAEDETVVSTATFQLDCPAGAPPPCTTFISPLNGATNVAMPPVLTWNAAPGATAYNIYFSTVNPPTTNIGSVTGTTATITGTTGGTTYYWYVAPTNTAGEASGCSSGTFSFTTAPPPPNDLVCNAIPLTLGGPQDCQNTASASATGDPAFTCSATNNTVWYTYTPAANGQVIAHMVIPGAPANALDGWIHWFTASGTCPTPGTFTEVPGSVCSEFGSGGNGDIDDVFSPNLIGGTTYYIMIDGVAGDFGEFCINLVAPPTCAAPTGVSVGSITNTTASVSFTGAGTAYIVDYGVSPYTTPGTGPFTGVGGSGVFTGAGSPIAMTGLTPSTTYQVYVRQDCTAGVGGYSSNTAVVSFTTTGPPPANDDATGAITLLTNSACTSSPYNNLNATQGPTEKFASCFQQNTTPGATFATHTVWYKFQATASTVRISTDIAGGSLADTHLALFNVDDPADYSTFTIISCDDDNGVTGNLRSILYAYGLNVGTIYYISVDGYNGSTGSFCMRIDDLDGTMLSTTASCTATQTPSGAQPYIGQVPIVDASGNLVAIVTNPAGGSVSSYSSALNIHTPSPPVRSFGGAYYLDRNYRIANGTATNANVRFYFLTTELNALTAADPLATLATLAANRQTETVPGCHADFVASNGTTTNLTQTPSGNGTSFDGTVKWITVLTPGFSNFYLKGGNQVLPASLLSFSGYKEGTHNTLKWTTATEQNIAGFEVQRSADGVNYTAIGFVNSQALAGTSTAQLNYTFLDNNPVGAKQYYRLRQVDLNGNAKLSNIVLIRGDKPVTLSIAGLFPNPAKSQISVLLDAPSKDKVTLVVMDAAGRAVIQQSVNVETGSNTIPVDISRLTNGTYMVKLVCSSNCETALAKFVKQ